MFLLQQGIARDSQRATDPQGKGRKEEKNSVYIYIYIASLRVEGIERGKKEKQVFFLDPPSPSLALLYIAPP